MGSTGTRMYAYNIKKLKNLPVNSVPEITEIAFSKSTDKKAIASYCSKNKRVGRTYSSPCTSAYLKNY